MLEVINLAEKQMQSDEKAYIEHVFFKEYFRTFNTNGHFHEAVLDFKHAYTLNKVNEVVTFLKSAIEKIYNGINRSFPLDFDVGIIIFIGDCSYDGHGILIEGKPYAFFDLSAIIPRIGIYNFDVFLTHELLHAIHYYLNPEYYRANLISVEEKFFKTLLSEGIATYCSYVLNKNNKEDIFWFGFIDDKQLDRWSNNCENMKADIGKDLSLAISEETFNLSLYNRLFSIEDFTKLHMYRLGYYYGAKIIEEMFKNHSLEEVFKLNYHAAKTYVYRYFHT